MTSSTRRTTTTTDIRRAARAAVVAWLTGTPMPSATSLERAAAWEVEELQWEMTLAEMKSRVRRG